MSSTRRPRVLLVRGHQATPWELAPWQLLRDDFDVTFAHTRRNGWDVSSLPLEAVPARTALDAVPQRIAAPIAAALGDRYRGFAKLVEGAEVVHAEELSYWFAADAARARSAPGARFKLVQTVWETIPLLEAYRTPRARKRRNEVLAHTDLFLAATRRAADALRLEGVQDERIEIAPPGIDVDRFATAGAAPAPGPPVLVSPGRLVWEKGHQDVLRAVALLRRESALAPGELPRVRVIGTGPEEDRLRAHAAELGVSDLVEIGGVGYDEMPGVLAGARAMVLMSLPSARGGLHPLDVPRVFWEEQFGMVLAEAMAAELPIVAADSGAIREVCAGSPGVTLVAAGDWRGLADALAAGPLRSPARAAHPPELVRRHSLQEAAARVAAAYRRVLA